MGKYGKTGQVTDDNIIRRMRFACWITKVRNTVRICNTYCFTTATVVTLTLLNITHIRSVLVLVCFPSLSTSLSHCFKYSVTRNPFVKMQEILFVLFVCLFVCYCILFSYNRTVLLAAANPLLTVKTIIRKLLKYRIYSKTFKLMIYYCTVFKN